MRANGRHAYTLVLRRVLEILLWGIPPYLLRRWLRQLRRRRRLMRQLRQLLRQRRLRRHGDLLALALLLGYPHRCHPLQVLRKQLRKTVVWCVGGNQQ